MSVSAPQQAISARTQLCGIFLHPAGHTRSPAMHNAAFRALGIDAVYLAFDIAPSALPTAVEAARALGVRQLAISIPHKQAILPLLDEVDETARRIGAVNTVTRRDGRLVGSNTDWIGADGGFASYVVVRETALVPVPREIPPEQACLLTCPIGVALQGAEDVGEIAAGEWVMVTGASGGLGVHALQIAKALGARTVAPRSTLSLFTWCRKTVGKLSPPCQRHATISPLSPSTVRFTPSGFSR